ncbi:MAG: GIY-YIG nuclease family protein [candidate division Zixibacteria bacterium]|nr:GIY-YIG nuclease family protein [candidate division Zixibacteria bacterium]
MGTYHIYILANNRNGTFYIGVTNDLLQRVYEHRNDLIDGFTRKYGVHPLVYFLTCGDAYSAIRREKQLKRWKRAWKIRWIEERNPESVDLWHSLGGE